MMRFYITPPFIQSWYSSLIWKMSSANAIYLTFDDGPNPETTPWLLNELGKIGAKATFFCLGKNLEKSPDLAKRIIDEGHHIGNHTQTHQSGWRSGANDYLEDINKCDKVLLSLNIHSDLFRPPYGRIKRSQIRRLSDKKIIMWSHLSWDFDKKTDTIKSINKLQKAKPGSILVFHDSIKAFDHLKVILPEILSFFQSKGLKFEAIA